MRSIFLEKSSTKCGGETSPRPFPGKLELSIKPLQSQRELENRKRKEHRIENNEAESSVLAEQDRRSKRQKSNDNRSNECIIWGNQTFRKGSKLYRLCETDRAELFSRAAKFKTDAVFTKVLIFDKPDDLFAADIMSYKQCMNR